jgi:hypothetical protein
MPRCAVTSFHVSCVSADDLPMLTAKLPYDLAVSTEVRICAQRDVQSVKVRMVRMVACLVFEDNKY